MDFAQGYLLKKSTGLRKEWKRRYFVLDSLGMLYYFSSKVDTRNTLMLYRASQLLQYCQECADYSELVMGRRLYRSMYHKVPLMRPHAIVPPLSSLGMLYSKLIPTCVQVSAYGTRMH